MRDQNLLSLEKSKQIQSLMSSIKVAIRKRKNAHGLHPIIIRIYKDGKPSIITTGRSYKYEYLYLNVPNGGKELYEGTKE